MPIVLVHGAWAGAWSWRDAARLLRAQGFDVYAPTMTGLAERAHVAPSHVSLSTHIADIAGLLRFEELENVLLVGHSYGGMVITGAADREPHRVAGMVYLDAFLPESGQSLWDIAGPQRAQAQKRAAEAHDGGRSVPRAQTHKGAGPATRWDALFTPQPIGALSEKWVSVREEAQRAWPPRHYILCTAYADSPFQALAARVRQAIAQGDEGWDYSELGAGHDVLRTDPQTTAQRIAEIAHGWGLRA